MALASEHSHNSTKRTTDDKKQFYARFTLLIAYLSSRLRLVCSPCPTVHNFSPFLIPLSYFHGLSFRGVVTSYCLPALAPGSVRERKRYVKVFTFFTYSLSNDTRVAVVVLRWRPRAASTSDNKGKQKWPHFILLSKHMMICWTDVLLPFKEGKA